MGDLACARFEGWHKLISTGYDASSVGVTEGRQLLLSVKSIHSEAFLKIILSSVPSK